MGVENLAPIDTPNSLITKQYADNIVVVSATTPTATNAELWVDTSVAKDAVAREELDALIARVAELERRLA